MNSQNPTPPTSDAIATSDTAIAQAFREYQSKWPGYADTGMAGWIESRAREIAAQPGEGDDREAVIACLGDDAAGLLSDNPEDERAHNMLRAAELLSAPPHVADALDGERLDYMQAHPGQFTGGVSTVNGRRNWFHAQGHGYFPTIREAIDAAIAARAEAGGKS